MTIAIQFEWTFARFSPQNETEIVGDWSVNHHHHPDE
jgi:hypothetical protein